MSTTRLLVLTLVAALGIASVAALTITFNPESARAGTCTDPNRTSC